MNKNSDKNLTKPLDPVATSETNLPDTSIKKEYQEPVNRLEERQKEASHREDIEDRKSNRKLREKYAKKMFWAMCIWSFIVIFILILSGFQFLGFQLNKWVLVTLIGGTTASVFAIVRAIIEGLFKNK